MPNIEIYNLTNSTLFLKTLNNVTILPIKSHIGSYSSAEIDTALPELKLFEGKNYSAIRLLQKQMILMIQVWQF